MAQRYNRALDLILAGVLAFKAGKAEMAAQQLQLAAEDDGFDDAVEMIDNTNEDALAEGDEGDDAGEATACNKTTASFTRATARLRKATASDEDVEDAMDEIDFDNAGDDLLGDDAGDRPAPAPAPNALETPPDAVTSRLDRAKANRRVLSSTRRG